MRSTLAVCLMFVGLARVARADEPTPMYACHVPSAETKISIQFKPDIDLRDLVTWAASFTCKNIVLSAEAERAAPRVTIIAPNAVTPKRALALFVDALETEGLVVTIKADTILIKTGPSLPLHCPDVSPPSSSSSSSGPQATPGELAPYPGSDSDAQLHKLIDSGIKAIDATHYEVTKALVDAVLSDPMGMAKGVRMVPALTNGKAAGFKLYAIRPSSLFAKLGFDNGDTLETINGYSFDSADKALEVYTKLRDATKLDIQIVRRGKPLTLVITVKS